MVLDPLTVALGNTALGLVQSSAQLMHICNKVFVSSQALNALCLLLLIAVLLRPKRMLFWASLYFVFAASSAFQHCRLHPSILEAGSLAAVTVPLSIGLLIVIYAVIRWPGEKWQGWRKETFRDLFTFRLLKF